MKVEIEIKSIEDCLEISALIPEFIGTSYDKKEYEKRLLSKPHLILVAYSDGTPAGFKVGYEKNQNGVFYSWMGGVIPQFRKNGIARALANEQEKIVKENGYTSIEFKTRNYLKPMLIFGISNGFNITGIEKRELAHENRIWLRKELKL